MLHNNTVHKRQALEQLSSGNATVVNFHVTHHAGTFLFLHAKLNGLRLDGMNGIFNPNDDDSVTGTEQQIVSEWRSNITSDTFAWRSRPKDAKVVGGTRQWLAIEQPLPRPDQDNIPWNNKHLVFMTLWRHPVSRALAGDGGMQSCKGLNPKYPDQAGLEKPGDWSCWLNKPVNDNYALRWLIGKPVSKGDVTRADLEEGVRRLELFSVILIAEWLPQSLSTLCAALPSAFHTCP